MRAQFPDYNIGSIRLDNAGEFTSKAFNEFCASIGIRVEHPVAHVHTQNGLAESFIKRLQLIARPLIMKTNLPVTVWGMPFYTQQHLYASDLQAITSTLPCN